MCLKDTNNNHPTSEDRIDTKIVLSDVSKVVNKLKEIERELSLSLSLSVRVREREKCDRYISSLNDVR